MIDLFDEPMSHLALLNEGSTSRKKVATKRAAEDWHPQIADKATTLAALRREEARLERAVRSYLREYHLYVSQHADVLAASPDALDALDTEALQRRFVELTRPHVRAILALGGAAGKQELTGLREPAGTARIAHLPGQHDQMDHGNRYGIGPTSSNDISSLSDLKDFTVIPTRDAKYDYYTHAVRYPSELDRILEHGIQPARGGDRVYASRDLVRDRGSGYVVFRTEHDAADEGIDWVEPGLSYPEFTVPSVPAEDVVRVVREVPTGVGNHTIREDELAQYALENQGLDDEEVRSLPPSYQQWFTFESAKSTSEARQSRRSVEVAPREDPRPPHSAAQDEQHVRGTQPRKGRATRLLAGLRGFFSATSTSQPGSFIAAEPAIESAWTVESPEAQAWITDHGLELAKGLDETTIERLRTLLVNAQREGISMPTITQRIDSMFDDFSTWRSRLIAQTETIHAYSEGSLQVYEDAGVQQKQWLDGQTNSCPICVALDGDIIDLDDEFDADGESVSGPPAHPGCVLPDTEVTALDVEAAYRAQYQGYVLELLLADRKLTVSQNHPVLTPQGFVPAHLLQEGDDVICGSFSQGGAPAIDPDVQPRPTTAAEVFVALSKSSSVPAIHVPASPEQFHGDGASLYGDVDIVRADRLLVDDLDPTLAQPTSQEALAFGNRLPASLNPLRHPDPPGYRFPPTPLSVVGSGRQRSTLVGGHPLHTQGVCLAHSSRCDARPKQADTEHVPAYTKLQRELLFRFASNVSVERILEIRRVWYSGHVYDLQTFGSVYSGNGVIVHNCRCAVRAVFQ